MNRTEMTNPEIASSPGSRSAERLDRSHRQRELQRRVIQLAPILQGLDARRRELSRRFRRGAHIIDFFHQVDDAYSHLALQAIGPLLDRYQVEFRFHLTSQTDRAHAPEPAMLATYARRDCAAVAPHYGLEFPAEASCPSKADVAKVEGMLAGLVSRSTLPANSESDFLKVARAAGQALWNSDGETLDRLATHSSMASPQETADVIAAGNKLRSQKRHYSGGMFWYAGQWYWGVDRLYHLENRLIELGAERTHQNEICFKRPPLDPGKIQNEGRLTLEFFPSLRSPYTAMIFDRSLALAASVAIPVRLRPVMPMVMRGVPAPGAKGLYIMLDALREAEAIGAPFGNMYDPIGTAVERGYAIWAAARDQERGDAFLSSFLRSAFVEGRPSGSIKDLRRIAEESGLCFEEVRAGLENDGWRDELEHNRLAMYQELGVWGVPSYRLQEKGQPDLCVWGQDRLWLIADEIRRRLANV
ncbi:MAG: DsbA family protein [Myxococcota bacterium]